MPEFASFADDTWFRWQFVSKILLMTLVMTAIVNTRNRFRMFALVICGCIGTIVAKTLPFMIMTGGQFRIYGPRGSMLADNNDMGLILNMTLPLFFFMARSDPNPRIRKIMWFLFLVTIPAIFFTYSRGAFLGLAGVMIYMLMRLRHRLVLIPILLLAGGFAVFLTPQHWQTRMDFRQQGALLDQSAEERLNSWTYCWRLAKDYPLTGGGFEAFTPDLFYRFAPDPNDRDAAGTAVHGPHSIYFQVLAEHGFVGLGLYMLLLMSTFLSLRKVKQFGLQNDDPQLRSYALMLECGLIGFLITGAFLGRAYFDYYFTFVACAVMLKRLCVVENGPSSELFAQREVMGQEEPHFAEAVGGLIRFAAAGLNQPLLPAHQ